MAHHISEQAPVILPLNMSFNDPVHLCIECLSIFPLADIHENGGICPRCMIKQTDLPSLDEASQALNEVNSAREIPSLSEVLSESIVEPAEYPNPEEPKADSAVTVEKEEPDEVLDNSAEETGEKEREVGSVAEEPVLEEAENGSSSDQDGEQTTVDDVIPEEADATSMKDSEEITETEEDYMATSFDEFVGIYS